MVEAEGRVSLVRVLSSPAGAVQGQDFDAPGRIDMALLQERLPFGDHDFYLCGPQDFMQALYDGLRGLDVRDSRIHSEGFGRASLKRSGDFAEDAPLPPPATRPVAIIFTESGKEARWNPGDGSLLELAEGRGLNPAFGCRGGTCGRCRASVLKGAITYASRPAFEVEAGKALLCCAVPAESPDTTLHIAI